MGDSRSASGTCPSSMRGSAIATARSPDRHQQQRHPAGNGRLPHGEPQRIEQDSVFLLGDFEIRARLLREPDELAMDVGRPQPAGSIIPDDAFLALDRSVAGARRDGADAPNSTT
ncbi:hypothetical protein ACPA9J_07875 [Pseudomonas aeruginosa]